MARRSRHELETSERFYREKVEAAGPFIEIAAALHTRVAERLSKVTQAEMDSVLADTIAKREDELVRQGIEAKIEALPIAQLLGMYARIIGDDSVNEPLKRIAAIKQRELARQASTIELREMAIATKAVDLRLLQVGQVVDIGLYGSPSNAGSAYSSGSRQFSARKYDADNNFEVIRDECGQMGHGTSKTLPIPPGTVGPLGTALFKAEGPSIAPHISLLSNIAMSVHTPSFSQDMYVLERAYVGLVSIDNQRLLDAHPVVAH